MKIANFEVGNGKPFFLMSGPCVIESEQMAMDTAGYLAEVTKDLGINFVYKSSFDKANRSSINSFRGLGVDKGLEILAKVKKHTTSQLLQMYTKILRLLRLQRLLT